MARDGFDRLGAVSVVAACDDRARGYRRHPSPDGRRWPRLAHPAGAGGRRPAASGLANREIATRLFVSPRTVSAPPLPGLSQARHRVARRPPRRPGPRPGRRCALRLLRRRCQSFDLTLQARRRAMVVTSGHRPVAGPRPARSAPCPQSPPETGPRSFTRTGAPVSPSCFHHGWPLSSDDWDAQMMFFALHGFRVVAHDRRGHGRSTQTSTGTT